MLTTVGSAGASAVYLSEESGNIKLAKVKVGLVALALAVGAVVAVPSSAEAADVTRNCGASARMCLHYNSPSQGLNAEFGSDTNIRSFNPNVNGGIKYKFKAGFFGSKGASVNVWNNAGGARNFTWLSNYGVWENSDYKGRYVVVPYGYSRDLGVVKNNNASMRWI